MLAKSKNLIDFEQSYRMNDVSNIVTNHSIGLSLLPSTVPLYHLHIHSQ